MFVVVLHINTAVYYTLGVIILRNDKVFKPPGIWLNSLNTPKRHGDIVTYWFIMLVDQLIWIIKIPKTFLEDAKPLACQNVC